MATSFTVNLADLTKILAQIKIAERHAAGENLVDIIGQDAALQPLGLRTVDGSFNNLLPGQSEFGAADTHLPAHAAGRLPQRRGWRHDHAWARE